MKTRLDAESSPSVHRTLESAGPFLVRQQLSVRRVDDHVISDLNPTRFAARGQRTAHQIAADLLSVKP